MGPWSVPSSWGRSSPGPVHRRASPNQRRSGPSRGITDRPGKGSLTAGGLLIFDRVAGRTFGKLDVNLTANNLLDADWREARFADESAVARGRPIVEQMHFTPGIPLTATLTAAYRF